MARTTATGTPHQDTVATTHTGSSGVTKDIEKFDATSAPLTATLPTAVGIVGRSFTIIKVDSTTNAVNVATFGGTQTITGTGGTTDAIISQGAAKTYTSDGANWVTSSTAGIPFTDPGADKVLYFQNSTKAVKPVTIGGNLTFSSGTLDAVSGSTLTVGTTPIASGTSGRLVYEAAGNVLGELILGTNLAIAGSTLNASGGSVTDVSTRAKNSGTQTFVRNVATTWVLNAEDYDTDTSHFTSDAALSGSTFTATANSPTITGVGTAFTTDLAVGQLIKIPGAGPAAGPAYCVVTAIGSNTSATVATQTQPVTNASGIAASTVLRVSGALVARTAGKYAFTGSVSAVGNSTSGDAVGVISYNGDNATSSVYVGYAELTYTPPAAASRQMVMNVAGEYNMAQWDYLLAMAVFEDTTTNVTSHALLPPTLSWHKLF